MALEAHKALRAALTTQIQTQQPGMDARTIWQVVSQDAGEHDAWRERQHRRWVVARTQERIRWRRGNFAHQESRRLVDTYDVLAIEDLSVLNLVRNHALADIPAEAPSVYLWG